MSLKIENLIVDAVKMGIKPNNSYTNSKGHNLAIWEDNSQYPNWDITVIDNPDKNYLTLIPRELDSLRCSNGYMISRNHQGFSSFLKALSVVIADGSDIRIIFRNFPVTNKEKEQDKRCQQAITIVSIR